MTGWRRTGRQRILISRRTAVLTVLVGGAVLLVVSLLTWAHGSAALTVGGSTPVEVTGAQGAGIVPSAALVVLAAGLAIGLAGRIARIIAAVAVALAGLVALIAAIGFTSDPAPALLRAAGQESGVPELTGSAATTLWPVVAIVISVVLTLLGAVLPVVMGAWQRVGARYERGGTAGQGESAPSDQDKRAEPPAGTGGREGTTRQRISDWDALSRGEDPSETEDR